MGDSVPNSTNINELVAAIENSKNLIDMVVKTILTMTKNEAKIKQLARSTKSLNIIKSTISLYADGLRDIVGELQNITNDSTLVKFATTYAEIGMVMDANGELKVKYDSDSQLVKIMHSISSCVEMASKMFGNVDVNKGLFKSIGQQKLMRLYVDGLIKNIQDVVKSLSDISTDNLNESSLENISAIITAITNFKLKDIVTLRLKSLGMKQISDIAVQLTNVVSHLSELSIGQVTTASQNINSMTKIVEVLSGIEKQIIIAGVFASKAGIALNKINPLFENTNTTDEKHETLYNLIKSLSVYNSDDMKLMEKSISTINGMLSDIIKLEWLIVFAGVLAKPAVIATFAISKILIPSITKLIYDLIDLCEDNVVQSELKSIKNIIDITTGICELCASLIVAALLTAPAIAGSLVIGLLLLPALEYISKKIVESKFSPIGENQTNEILESIKNMTKVISSLGLVTILCAGIGLFMMVGWKVILYGLAGVTAMIFGLSCISHILASEKFATLNADATIGLLILAGTIGLICADILLMALAGVVIIKMVIPILVAFAGVVTILAALTLILLLVSLAGPVAIAGAIGLAILAGVIALLVVDILLLAAVVAILNKITPETITGGLNNLKLLLLGDKDKQGNGSDGILSILLSVGSHIFAMVGVLVTLGLVTGIAIELTVITLLFIANIKLLENVDIKSGGENIGAMINTFIGVVDIFAGKGARGSAKLMLKITAALAAFTQLMIIAGCISAMAKVLVKLSNLEMTEFDASGHPTGRTVKMTTSDITNAAMTACTISKFFVDLVSGGINGDSSLKLDLDNLKDVSLKATVKMAELNCIVHSIGKMSDVIQNLAQLKIADIDENTGKIIGYHQMNKNDFTRAADGVATICTCLINAVTDKKVLDKLDKLKSGFLGIGGQTGKMKDIMEMGSGLKDIYDIIKDVNETGNKVDEAATSANVSKLLSCIIPKPEDLEGVDLKDVRKTVEQNTKNYIKYIESINKVDTSKVKSVTDMFGKMAQFSESINGNFEKLADVISNDLLEALGLLNENIEKAQSKTTQSTSNTSTSIGTTLKQDEKVKQTIQADKKDDKKQPINIKQIEAKLEDIIHKLDGIKNNTARTDYYKI